jgi:hypothetical protein
MGGAHGPDSVDAGKCDQQQMADGLFLGIPPGTTLYILGITLIHELGIPLSQLVQIDELNTAQVLVLLKVEGKIDFLLRVIGKDCSSWQVRYNSS